MPRRPTKPVLNVTAFSIVSQVTGPPFSQALTEPRLREQLMRELGGSAETERDRSGPPEPKKPKPPAGKAARSRSRPRAGK